MGIDAGFDTVPCLSKGGVDKQNWQSFIEVIKERYQNDDLVDIKPNYLQFRAGEHPMLPSRVINSCGSAQRSQEVTLKE